MASHRRRPPLVLAASWLVRSPPERCVVTTIGAGRTVDDGGAARRGAAPAATARSAGSAGSFGGVAPAPCAATPRPRSSRARSARAIVRARDRRSRGRAPELGVVRVAATEADDDGRAPRKSAMTSACCAFIGDLLGRMRCDRRRRRAQGRASGKRQGIRKRFGKGFGREPPVPRRPSVRPWDAWSPDRRGRGRDRRAARRGPRARGLRGRARRDRRGGARGAPSPTSCCSTCACPDIDGYDVCRGCAPARTCRSSWSPPRARRSTASSASSSAPTTTSSSRSASASWSRASAPSRAARARRGDAEAPLRVGALEVDPAPAARASTARELALTRRSSTCSRCSPRPGAVVSRERILEEVWQTTLVRPDEDDRRPRGVAAQEARRSRLDRDRARRRLPPPRSVSRRLLAQLRSLDALRARRRSRSRSGSRTRATSARARRQGRARRGRARLASPRTRSSAPRELSPRRPAAARAHATARRPVAASSSSTRAASPIARHEPARRRRRELLLAARDRRRAARSRRRRASATRARSEPTCSTSPCRSRRRQVHGAVRITYPTSALDARVHRYWLMLAAIGAIVLAVATLARADAGALDHAAASATSRRPRLRPGTGDLSARAPDRRGPARGARARARVQRDRGQARAAARLPAGVRRRRLPPAAHAADGAAAPAREPRARRRRRTSLEGALAEVDRLSRLVERAARARARRCGRPRRPPVADRGGRARTGGRLGRSRRGARRRPSSAGRAGRTRSQLARAARPGARQSDLQRARRLAARFGRHASRPNPPATGSSCT